MVSTVACTIANIWKRTINPRACNKYAISADTSEVVVDIVVAVIQEVDHNFFAEKSWSVCKKVIGKNVTVKKSNTRRDSTTSHFVIANNHSLMRNEINASSGKIFFYHFQSGYKRLRWWANLPTAFQLPQKQNVVSNALCKAYLQNCKKKTDPDIGTSQPNYSCAI